MVIQAGMLPIHWGEAGGRSPSAERIMLSASFYLRWKWDFLVRQEGRWETLSILEPQKAHYFNIYYFKSYSKAYACLQVLVIFKPSNHIA